MAMRTHARTTPFMPGESPPDVIIAIFFFAAIVVVLDCVGDAEAERCASVLRGARKRIPTGIERRTKARRARNGDATMEKGRTGRFKLVMGMLQAVGLGSKTLGQQER
jgi:hypothetical protein